MATVAHPDNKPVDLVFVIDTSRSMSDEAQGLSTSFDSIVEEAKKECPSDLEVRFLGIEGTFAKTKFSESVRDHLVKSGVDKSLLRGRLKGTVKNSGAQEDVARAVEDIATHHNWRAGAERNIFVLGDESMEGGGMQVKEEQTQARKAAIEVALGKGVKVFTYLGTPAEAYPPGGEEEMLKEYELLALRTGGNAYSYKTGVADFKKVLKETICASRVPPEKAIEERKEEADKLEGGNSSSENCAQATDICAQAGEIVRAVNSLADVLNKLLDTCGGGAGSGSAAGKQTSGCRCNEHAAKPPARNC